MCGFSGIIGEYDKDDLLSFDKISHRGPDDYSEFTYNNLYINFYRLSIVDIEKGMQPKFSKDENYALFFNGEIYNYKEIYQELKKNNIDVDESSETEILLNSLLLWGKDAIKKLNGMFSICLVNKKENKILLIRDQFGIKPLYYKLNHNHLSFSSESKAILPKEFELNKNSLAEYLSFQFYLTDQTLDSGVKQLDPGSYLEINMDKFNNLKPVKYYELSFAKSPKEYTTIKDLDLAINKSIKNQVNAEVEIGTHLSGGIDSSLVSVIASNYIDNLKAFHGFFPEASNKFSELEFAEDVCKENDITLVKVPITYKDFIENFKDIIYQLDYPIVGPGVFPQFMVNKEASSHVKVLLGGQGGDEIFAGYARYLINYLEQTLLGSLEETQSDDHIVLVKNLTDSLVSLNSYIPLIKKMWAIDLFQGPDIRYYHLLYRDFNLDWLEDNFVKEIENSKNSFLNIFNSTNEKSLINKMLHFDTKYILPGLLHVEDRVSMFHSVESRVPYLDQDVFEVAQKLDPLIKFESGKLKNPLKIVSKKYLPASVYSRKDKMGFPVPLDEWIKNREFKEFIIDIIKNSKISEEKIFNEEMIINEIKENNFFDRSLWGLICLSEWYNSRV
tara:strand:+ start:2135 stop:3979 length:1845 start_codon:yes stop_codon:yes gene_type:complete